MISQRVCSVAIALLGESGPMLLDDKCDREPDFWVWQVTPENQELHVFTTVIMSDPNNQVGD